MGLILFLLGEKVSGSFSEKYVEILTPFGKYFYLLDTDRIVTVKGLSGDTVIEIKDGNFRIINSNCPTKQCTRAGWSHSSLIPQVCLPNGISVIVNGRGKKKKGAVEIDGVAM